MERACRKVLNFERGVFGAEYAEDALAGMKGFWRWMSGSQERQALLL